MAIIQKVKVLRGFRHNGEVIGPGSVLGLDKPVAIELRTANKVEFVSSDVKDVHKTDLPNPNVVQAMRNQARAASIEAAVKAAGAK
jgi:hypothetical protein